MASIKYWLWLTNLKGFGAAGAMRVLNHFATPERAYYADPEEYELIEGLTAFQCRALGDKDLSRAEAILADCQRLSVRIMTIQDGDYPERLRQIFDPPVVLYIRGRTFAFDDEVAIGVVGSRNPSVYGRKTAAKLGLELASGGALVVSGIAQGLDAEALRGALKGGGPVVSVLAGGVDVPYPVGNRYLYEDVAAAGALISEYPPGTRHLAEHFPVRNRIISGLCLGVVAVECRPFGGTMSTASRVLEQDRDLFAVPGPIDAPLSEGPNRLIQQGAKLVTCGSDILEEYWQRYPLKLKASAPLTPEAAQERLSSLAQEREASAPTKKEEPPAAPERELIPAHQQKVRFTDDQIVLLHALGRETRSADQLVELTQIPARRVLSALTMLQLDGAVEEQPGRRFSALVALEE